MLEPKSKLSRHHLHHFSSPITPNRPSPSPTSTILTTTVNPFTEPISITNLKTNYT
ncbi:hypothetical protein CXB51_017622 [Gossypium anomalum]|uniref:Uncharacterized protein n=1 Tax=Gossypium anomalum TaxID=47600 RepID=A0A8J6D146_9ROSI|nr:hypothetical protein CXB51_017622 [Gossypium anomalum]